MEVIKSEVIYLKNTLYESTIEPATHKKLLVEIHNQSARAKNVIIVGIPE